MQRLGAKTNATVGGVWPTNFQAVVQTGMVPTCRVNISKLGLALQSRKHTAGVPIKNVHER